MADNVALPGIDTIVAADDCGGVLVQRVKVVGGADGEVGPGLAIDENGAVPVTLPAGSVPVAVQGTVPVSLPPGPLAVSLPPEPLPVAVTLPDPLPVTLPEANQRSDGAILAVLSDLSIAVRVLMESAANPCWVDPLSGRVRVMLDTLGGAQVVGTVTQVTNLTNFNGVATNVLPLDAMDATFALCVRERIS